MAQSDITENLRNTSETERITQEIWSTDVMTGGSDRRMQLYYQLIQNLKKADSVDIIVSFLMESGVKMLLEELDNALKRGAKIRILTGNYLGITQPSALYLLKKKLGSRVDMRFYNEKERSFHPKSYIFHYERYSDIYIGSSNISRSALTSGIEWNYRFSSVSDPKNYEKFYQVFEDLFEHHSIIIDNEELKRYSQNWHRPAVAKDLERYEYSHQNEENKSEDTKVRLLYEPRGAQIEALCALEDTRAEGAKRALVQAATGVGKTYLAAFDSKSYERVLFVAHREEILKQAAASFRNVRNSEDYGFFTGEEKSTDKSVIFASVATLGRSEYLSEKYFAPDYSGLHLIRGRYDEKELNETYIGNVHRHDLIYKYYCKYGSKKALGFCCSRAHAGEMAKEFCERGIPSAAVYSNANGTYSEEREKAIEKLKSGEIRVIFSVDMFNEGVDITSVDMVMFLRPTESPIVFLQQLGRGLRRSKGKKYLNVLDFIGNYEKAGRVRFLLTGRTLGKNEYYNPADRSAFPDDCLIDFDMKLIDLFSEMDKKHLKVRDQIRNEYYRVKEFLGRIPSRMDLFTYMDDDIYRVAITHSKDNPFKRYLDFRKELGELTEEENLLYSGIGREFINLIENTNMSKVYKMPVLMAFYNHGNVRSQVSEEELLDSWKEFFSTGTNWKDLDTGITYEKYCSISDKEHIKKILQMPVHFLQESGKGFFIKKEGTALALKEDLTDVILQPAFGEQMKDVIEYRAMDYYRRRYEEKR